MRTKSILALAAALAIGTWGIAKAQQSESITLTEIRGMVFCEFLLISETDVTIYNTSADGPCDLDAFSRIDPGDLAREHGARKAQLIGPKYWSMDEPTLGLGEARNFGGIKARLAAKLPLAALGSGEGADPYKPYVTKKAQRMVFKAGRPVYELVDAKGNIFVMNAFGDRVPDNDPARLDGVLPVPDGWTYRVRSPERDLVIDQKGDVDSSMVGDAYRQYYSLETAK